MIPDFQNWTPERCKEAIIEWQNTKDPKIAAILLARFDRYILYTIYEMRKQTFYLRDEEMQDLYHTGVLGFYKGIAAFKPYLKPFFIILVIKAYVKSELRQFYSYKSKETSYEVFPDIASNDEMERDLDLKLLFDFVENSEDLTAEEKQLLTLRFKEDKSVKEISAELGCLSITIYKKLNRVIKKLKTLFADSNM